MKQKIVLTFFLATSAILQGQAAGVPPLKGIEPLPSSNQLAWQEMGMSAFCHFGINTFYDQERGNGTEDPNRFYPTNFSGAQWAKIFKDTGFKGVILTCKHHDGFCLWPSAYTDYGVKSSTWYKTREAATPGSGDVVKGVADACHELGLRFGVYLSPWDRNNTNFGKGADYNTYYENQLRELLRNYGEVDEVWWDGAKGDEVKQDYDYEAWAAIVHELQPKAVIFQGNYNTADVRWVGNENGFAPENCWSTVNQRMMPFPGGTKWMPAEADVSIRPGWFYHGAENYRLKTVSQLAGIYKNSVGRNAVLLLNVPPDRSGLISENDQRRLLEFKTYLDDTFATNLAEHSAVDASSTRGAGFEVERVLSGSSFWAAADGVSDASVTITLNAEKLINMVELEEAIQLGLRVTGYTIETWDGKNWALMATRSSMGSKAIVTFPAVKASKVRVNITHCRAAPAIRAIRIYNDSTVSQVNLAEGKPASSDSEEEGHAAAMGNDGDIASRWCAADAEAGHWWRVDLGKICDLTGTQVTWEMGRPETTYSYRIQVSSDGSNWNEVLDNTKNGSSNQRQTDNFNATARYVQITVDHVSNEQWASFYEFAVYGSPVESP